MGSRISLVLWLWVVLLAIASPAAAQATIANPSFEYGLNGWATYSYVPGEGTYGAEPVVGCTELPGCTFELLNPGLPPNGEYVCGIQSYGTNGNGGVYQSFNWAGESTFITVSARGFSEPNDNGCRVRMALVVGNTQERADDSDWVVFPWIDQWGTQQLTVPGPGSYTIFIEAYQPNSNAFMSTIWDDVRLGEQVTVTDGPVITPDPQNPDTGVIVTWTTDVPSTSRVDFGTTTEYGQFEESTELTTLHTITLAGLAHSSTYHCRVRSEFGTFFVESVDNQFDTPGMPVSITLGPNITPEPSNPETAAIVTWSTDVPSTSRVDFGTTPAYGRSVNSTALTTFHTVTLTGLMHSVTYHCRVRSTSGAYIVDSADTVFTTPIQLTNLSVVLSSDNLTATIDWQTDVPTDAQVEYWPEAGGHSVVTETGSPGTNHHLVLAVMLGKEYRIVATSHGSSPYTSISASAHLFTLPPPGNSLMNGGFEDTIGGEPDLYPWVQYTCEPTYEPINGLIGPYPSGAEALWNPEGSSVGIRAYNGSYFLGTAANWSNKNGGVFQQVSVMPNQYYTLSARFITYRWGGGDGYNTVRIGVDPNGGVEPGSLDVNWRTVYSDTNNSLWHTASLTMIGGLDGIATVFVEFRQIWDIRWHIAAVDGVSFSPPAPVSIGTLKSSQSSLGAILDSKIVTYASPTPVWYGTAQYTKAYVEDENRSAGVAVLFPLSGTDYPVAGSKLTVTGALAEYDKEAALMAECWTVDRGPLDPETGDPQGYALPKPFGLAQSMIGTAAVNQPPMFSNNMALCTVGLRVRMFGHITWASLEGDPGDVIAYVDDGGGIMDGSGHAGVRVYLPGKGGDGVWVGDYVAATGVLAIELINPDNWPDPTDFYAYSLFINAAEDWTVTAGS